MGGGPIPVQRNERAGNRDSGRVQCLDGALPSPQVRNSAQETEARAKRLDAHRASGWKPRQKGREEFESHPGNRISPDRWPCALSIIIAPASRCSATRLWRRETFDLSRSSTDSESCSSRRPRREAGTSGLRFFHSDRRDAKSKIDELTVASSLQVETRDQG